MRRTRDRLATLLHDAPEYVIGDLISPFKAVIDDAYRLVEERLHQAVRLRFGLPANLPAAMRQRIKKADQAAAYFEAQALAGFSEAEAARYFGRPGAIRVGADFRLDPALADEAGGEPLPEGLPRAGAATVTETA